MSELQLIESTLTQAVRRLRWQRALRGLWVGLLLAAITWLIALATYKLAPVPVEVLVWAAVAGAVVAAVGFIGGFLQKVSMMEAARLVDAKQNLKERVSTALEVSASNKAGRWRDLLIADAAAVLGQIELRRLIPFHLSKAARWAAVILIVVAGLGFVPEYRSQAYLKNQNELRSIRETGRELAELTRRSMTNRPPALDPTRRSLENVAELGDHLSKAKLTKNEALKDLASITDKLKDQAKELNQNPAMKRMRESAKSSGNSGSANANELQKKMEDLQKKLGDKDVDPKALDQLKQELQKLQKAAQGLANENGPDSKAMKQQMEESLASLSQQAKEMGLNMSDLDDAMAALAADKTDLFMKELDAALTDLEQLKQLAKAMKDLKAQMAQLGKDLAEQLEKGQASVAQKTLEKMIDELKKANLTDAQLQKMVDEVSRAVPPAEPYGKVAELLQQGARQMRQGQKGEAAQSLADAAKELQKLMDQAQDLDALLANLDALKNAQLAIGSGT